MPRVKRKQKFRKWQYSDHEKRVLLTGVGFTSNTFGHPKNGWDRKHIAEAWERLQSELLDIWASDEFAEYRSRDDRPFAVRFLAQSDDTYPFCTGRGKRDSDAKS